MRTITRFSVEPLFTMTKRLTGVASGHIDPDLVITGARALSTYSERILENREIWITGGRIAAVKAVGTYVGDSARRYDARGGLLAPGLVDPHLHIESIDGHGLRLRRGRVAERHHDDLLRQPRDRQCDGRRRNRGDAGRCAQGAAFDLPDRAEHRSRHHARSRNRRRRPDARKDRRDLRQMARSRRPRRKDGLRAGRHRRGPQPCHHRRSPEARASGLRPRLRPRFRRRLCRRWRHRYP